MALECNIILFVNISLQSCRSCFHFIIYDKTPALTGKLIKCFMCFMQVKGLLKEKKLEDLVDDDLNDNYIDVEVESLLQIALLCTQRDPTERPKMSEVVTMLEGNGGLTERWEKWLKVAVDQDVEHGSRRTSDWIVESAYKLSSVELSGPR